MRKYYIYQHKDFGNTYNLYYIEDNMDFDVPDEWVQVSRKEALHLCALEKARRRDDPAFSGFADTAIYPADYPRFFEPIENDKRYTLRANIWERA